MLPGLAIRRRNLVLWMILALLSDGAVAFAYKPAAPVRHDVFSSNRMFVLDVNPQSDTQNIFAANDRSAPLWTMPRKVVLETFFLSNSGRSVAVVQWQFVRVDDLDKPAVEFWNASGQFGAYAYMDLVSQPARKRGIGPIGGFWRTWLDGVQMQDDRLVVATSGPTQYEFDMSTGFIVDRSMVWGFAVIWAIGIGLVVVGIARLSISWRKTRGLADKTERRRLRLGGLSPSLTTISLGLYLTGIPLLANNVSVLLETSLLILSIAAFPLSLVSCLRIKSRKKMLRLVALVVYLSISLGLLVFLWF